MAAEYSISKTKAPTTQNAPISTKSGKNWQGLINGSIFLYGNGYYSGIKLFTCYIVFTSLSKVKNTLDFFHLFVYIEAGEVNPETSGSPSNYRRLYDKI